jgi:hypothetical protein
MIGACNLMSSGEQFQLSLSTGRTIALPQGARLSALDVTGHPGTAFAAVEPNPNDATVLGLKNLTAGPWTAVLADGTQRQVDPGRSLRLAAGTRVNFGPVYGEIVLHRGQAQAAKPSSAAASGQSYIARHWRGELSLPIAYWVNGGIFSAIWFAAESLLSSNLYALQIPALSILVLVFVLLVTAALMIWILVGVWRSAGHYRGAPVWATLARVAVVIGWIGLFLDVAVTIWFFFFPL